MRLPISYIMPVGWPSLPMNPHGGPRMVAILSGSPNAWPGSASKVARMVNSLTIFISITFLEA